MMVLAPIKNMGQIDEKELSGFIAHLHPNEVFECRILFKEKNAPNYKFFDSANKAARWIQGDEFNSDLIKGYYITLNPIDNTEQLSGATKDENISERKWLLLDIDPNRDANISATDKEKIAAHEVVEVVTEFLFKQGWGEPMRIDSGNGYHALYRLSGIPLNEAGDRKIKELLKVLHEGFSTKEAAIDTTVYNRSRITKLPGTLTRKGKHTPERPWRSSKLISYGGEQSVSLEQIEAVVCSLSIRNVIPLLGHRHGTDELTGKLIGSAMETPNETEENESILKGMLLVLSSDVDRDEWLSIVWSIGSLKWKNGKDIAQEWSKKAPHRYEDDDFNQVWSGYDPSKGISIGTLIHKARISGYIGAIFHQYTEANLKQEESSTDSMVKDLNSRFVLAPTGKSQPMIVRKIYSEALRCNVTQYTYLSAMKVLMQRETILINQGGKDKLVPKLDLWLNNPKAKIFTDGVDFNPNGIKNKNIYNLWDGYSVEPLDGECKVLTGFLKEVICSSNNEHFQYLIQWVARAIQKPGEIGEVALVLRGARGVGKTTIYTIMKRIFGNNCILIDRPELLTRGFNSHLRECVFAVADESVFVGNKKENEILKNQITGKTFNLEPKGVDVKTVPSYLTLVIISNNEHIINAVEDERRYFVLDVCDIHKQDYDYFNKLNAAINGDELRCFFKKIMQYDISKFNHRDIPQTDALKYQKGYSLDPFESWLCEVGQRGYVYSSKYKEEDLGCWYEEVSTELLVASFKQYCDEKRLTQYDRIGRQELGSLLIKKFPSKRSQGLIVGERCEQGYSRVVSATGRKKSYQLGSLISFQQRLTKEFGLASEFFENAECE